MCAAVCVLWVRSESHHDMLIVRLSADRTAWAESVRGGVQFGMMTNTWPGQFTTGWRTYARAANPFPLHTHAGFGADSAHINVAEPDGVHRRSVAVYEVLVPPYALLLTAAVLPAWWYLARRRRLRGPSKCPACGHDLRDSPDRCPGCGAVPGQDST